MVSTIFHPTVSPMDKANDLDVMRNMGKKQELVRRFSFISILALSATLLSSWEAIAGVFYAGLYNGGPVSLVYGMILSFIGTMALASSIAEMASSTPIAGAQYHWTFTYAPQKAAVFMSWMQGESLHFVSKARVKLIMIRLDHRLCMAGSRNKSQLSDRGPNSRSRRA
jgi:choline transport protein